MDQVHGMRRSLQTKMDQEHGMRRSLQLARAKAELSQEALNEAEATIELLTEALSQADLQLKQYERHQNPAPPVLQPQPNSSQQQRREHIEIAMSLRELCRTIESMCNMPDTESYNGRRTSIVSNQEQQEQQEQPAQMSLQERSIEAEHLLKRYAKKTSFETAKARQDAEDFARVAQALDTTHNAAARAATTRKPKQLVSSPSAKVSAKAMKSIKKSRQKIIDLENDVRDMQDEILATHRVRTETALHLTTALANIEQHKHRATELQVHLQRRTELFLPLLFSVRHVVNQYHSVASSEPTVGDLLKKIRLGQDFVVFGDGDGKERDEEGGGGGGGQGNADGVDIRVVTASAAQKAGGSMRNVLPSETEIDNLCADLSNLLKSNQNGTGGGSGEESSDDTYKVAEQMLLQARLQRQSAVLREENLHDEIERVETMNQALRNQLDDMKDQLAVMNLNQKLLQVKDNGHGMMSPPPHRVHDRGSGVDRSNTGEGGGSNRHGNQTLEDEMKALRNRCKEAIDLDASSDDDEEEQDEEEWEERSEEESGEEESSDDEEQEDGLQAPSLLSSERFLR
jgi:hypothetical protein